MAARPTPPSGGNDNSGLIFGHTRAEFWGMVGALGTIVGILIAIVFGVVQCSTGSNSSSQATSSVSTTATVTSSPQPTGGTSSIPAPIPPPTENEPPIHSSDTLSMSGSSPWGVSIFSFNSFWVRNPAGSSVTITVDGSFGVSTGDGASFALVANPSYSTCVAANYSVQSREWKDLPSGTTLCIKTTDTRVGRVQFIWKKGKEDPASDVRVIGVIWEPKHE